MDLCGAAPNVAGLNDLDYYRRVSHCSHPHQCAVNKLFAQCGYPSPCASIVSQLCELHPAGYDVTDVILFNVAVAAFFVAAAALEFRLFKQKLAKKP